MEKRERLCTIGGNVKLVYPVQKTRWSVLRKLKIILIKIIKTPAIPLLDIYPNKMKIVIKKDICPPYPEKCQLHFPRSLAFTISQGFQSV